MASLDGKHIGLIAIKPQLFIKLEIYIGILNCVLQHRQHIVTPALAELPIGAKSTKRNKFLPGTHSYTRVSRDYCGQNAYATSGI